MSGVPYSAAHRAPVLYSSQALGRTLSADDSSVVGLTSFTMPMPPSTNHLFKNIPGKGRVKTDHYEDFTRRGIVAIRQQHIKKISGYVLLVIGVERASKTSDIDNRLKALLDTITLAGIIDDDRFITGFAISWLPKANGLAHVSIMPVQSLSLKFHPSNEASTGGWFIEAQHEEDFDDGYLTE